MKTHIIAAKEFLHRGIITENLKDEVTKFSKWCDERAKGGNPIKYPEKILQIWRTRSENTIAPTEGAMIVDFIETIYCEDLDIIYNICLIRIIEKTMHIYVAPPIDETVAKIESYFDNEDIAAKMRVFMRTNKATYLNYK